MQMLKTTSMHAAHVRNIQCAASELKVIPESTCPAVATTYNRIKGDVIHVKEMQCTLSTVCYKCKLWTRPWMRKCYRILLPPLVHSCHISGWAFETILKAISLWKPEIEILLCHTQSPFPPCSLPKITMPGDLFVVPLTRSGFTVDSGFWLYDIKGT